jgi:hypothetical protein
MSVPGATGDYVFIVGMPRTGTTLTRRILNCSPDVSLGGESHFFGAPIRIRFWANRDFRDRIRRMGGLADETGVGRVADLVYATRKRNFWGWIARNVPRDRFVDAVLASDRSERAFLELVLELHAQGRRVRGEKTPANLHSVPTLIDWFPGARIVHTFRDPRAIFASQKRKQVRHGRWWRAARLPGVGLGIDLYSSLRMIVAWRLAARLHERYRLRYPGQYRLLRYEDLVGDPAETIRGLCDFLGIAYRDEMLDQTTRNSSFRSPDEVRGFDRAALDRWRDVLEPSLRWWFRVWCGRTLLSFGYDA